MSTGEPGFGSDVKAHGLVSKLAAFGFAQPVAAGA
jgi:hypothetical protein